MALRKITMLYKTVSKLQPAHSARPIRSTLAVSLASFAFCLFHLSADAQKVAVVARPDNSLKPAHLIVYRACDADVLTCDFVTPDGFAAIRTLSSDTGLTAILQAQRNSQDGPLSFRTGPKSGLLLLRAPVTLTVVLFGDTAIYDIDSIGVYEIKRSPQLLLGTAQSVPENVICVQLSGQDSKQSRLFIDSALTEFGPDLKTVVLPSGIYPCLSAPWVTRARSGRRNGSINRTALGDLACFEMGDPARREAFTVWIESRKGEPTAK